MSDAPVKKAEKVGASRPSKEGSSPATAPQKASQRASGSGSSGATPSEQHRTRWKDVDDVRQNLRRNGDLGTYSQSQLLALDGLAEKDKTVDRLVDRRTDQTIERADSLDELPQGLGFESLMHGRAEDNEHLDALVGNYVNDKLDARLEGQEGDDAARQAGQKWGRDVRRQMARDPALADKLQSAAEELSSSSETEERLQDVAEADDSIFTQAIRGAGDFLADGLGEALKAPIPGNPVGMLSVTSELSDQVGFDAGADLTRDVQGGLVNSGKGLITGTTDALADPVGTGKGLVELGRRGAIMGNPTTLLATSVAEGESPLEVMGENAEFFKKTGEASIQTYKDTAQDHGVVGALTHGAADAAMMVGTGGATRAPSVTSRVGQALRGSRELELPQLAHQLAELKTRVDDAPPHLKEAASTGAAGANGVDDFNPEQQLAMVERSVERGALLPPHLRRLVLQG